jgi:hypothetical protein
MSATPLTLKAFFVDGALPPPPESGTLAGLRDKVPGGEAGLKAAVSEVMEEIFGAPLADMLQTSWGKVDGLTKALAKSREDPKTVIPFPLLDHTVNTVHTPTIEVHFGRKRLAELPLEIELNLVLKGVALELQGGRIAGVRSGECSGQGVCTFAGQTLMKRATPAIPLPGRLTFGARP